MDHSCCRVMLVNVSGGEIPYLLSWGIRRIFNNVKTYRDAVIDADRLA